MQYLEHIPKNYSLSMWISKLTGCPVFFPTILLWSPHPTHQYSSLTSYYLCGASLVNRTQVKVALGLWASSNTRPGEFFFWGIIVLTGIRFSETESGTSCRWFHFLPATNLPSLGQWVTVNYLSTKGGRGGIKVPNCWCTLVFL